MQRTNNFVTVLLCVIILIPGIAKGKSLYTIVDTGLAKVWAYEIDANSLTYQTEYDSPYGSAVGLALNGDYMFLTFEGSDNVEVASAKTMTSVQLINAPGSSNLAGIAADQGKHKVYVVDRNGTSVYVYDWNLGVLELTLDDEIELEDLGGLRTWGLALDEENGRLYVTLRANTIRCYDTNDWSHLPDNDITVTHDAVGIAIDVPNQIIYTGSYYDQYLLSKYVISTETETTVDVRNITGGASSDHILGLAVDQDTGLIYATVGDITSSSVSERVLVFNPNLTLQWYSDDVGNPAGIAVAEVSYKPPFFDIVKDDNDVNCVEPYNEFIGNWLYYNITWDANGYADSNVVIIDFLPTEVVDFNSCTHDGVYDANNHTVTWDLGDITANDSNIFQIRCGVNYYARPGGIIRNICEIEGDTYASIYAIVDTNVCPYGSTIIYVDDDANGFENGTSWDDAYNLLQDGLTGARNCGASVVAIWVAAGTYKPIWDSNDMTANETFELIEDVALFGHFAGTETDDDQRNFADANNETILEGQIGDIASEAVKYIVTAEYLDAAVLDGFTIKGSYNGAGIYLDDANVSIINCKIKNNDNYGICALDYSYPDIHNCTFVNNDSYSVYSGTSWLNISSSIFDGNSATWTGRYMTDGSNISVEDCNFKNHGGHGIKGTTGGTLTVSDSTFDDNQYGLHLTGVTTTVTNCSIKNSNDGIRASGSDLTINHSVIANNSLRGLYYMASGCNLTLENSVVRYNSRQGLWLRNSSTTTIKNNWIHNNGTDQYTNQGAGVYFDYHTSVPLVRNNTIYDNYTYGIESSENGADPNIINCIIYDNNSNDFYRMSGSFNTVNYCNLQNSHTGTGNIIGDPGFENPTDPNDLHIAETSQCKDTGDPNGSYGDETDIDGESRVVDGQVDIGADEYYWSPADFNQDGIVNFIDYALFTSAWQTTPNDVNDYNDIFDLQDNNSID